MPPVPAPQPNPNLALFAQMYGQQMGMTPQNLQAPQPMGQPPGGGMPPGGQPPQGAPPGGAPGQPPGMPPQQMGGQPGQPGQPPGGRQGGQIPPQMMQMLMQRMQQAQQQQGQQGQQPPGQPGAQPGQSGPGQPMTPQQMAAMGRMGDNTVAHMTKGEIGVPPQVQTPKVLATLKKAFENKHVPPQNFVAGSPTQQHNPSTGAPEMSFWSSFLPAALGIAGAVVAPELIGPELGMSGALSGALGSAVGTGAGDMMTGDSGWQSLMGAGMAGAGGYLLGGGLSGSSGSGAAGAGSSAASSAPSAVGAAQSYGMGTPFGGMSDASAGDMLNSSQFGGSFNQNQGQINSFMGGGAGAGQAAQQTAQAATQTPGWQNLYGGLSHNLNLGGIAGGVGGGMLGNAIGAPAQGNPPNLPPGFTTGAPSVSSLPSAQTQLGQTNSNQPLPTFQGYNPATNFPAAYNFFPQNQNMTQPVSVT